MAAKARDAIICTYECTFCSECMTNILHIVGPNCGGGFDKRPIRPMAEVEKHPPKKQRIHKPVIVGEFEILKEKFEGMSPHKR